MSSKKMFIVSHAPFWHNGSNIPERCYGMIWAALPAVALGIVQYGLPAVGVICLAVSTAILAEWLMNRATKRSLTITDGNAALLGLLFAMLIPATTPWWVVMVGTILSVVIGLHIFGGIGANPFHPVVVAMMMLTVSWPEFLDFNASLVNYDFTFNAIFPLTLSKNFGPAAVTDFTPLNLLLGRQVGGIGTTFGLGLIAGGIYLMAKRYIRWEVCLSFLAGIFLTALAFHLAEPDRYAGPIFHLLTGYTLICAFFLLPESASSPVNPIPMFIYGAGAGILTMLIRNIGNYYDGVLLAVLLMNLVNPLLDKIRPKALGKVA
ncbi:MAG: RnfABCDGE type electron transport complex subunit D [Desulfosarcina sp.]|nr:RnfABCDGE type electron transport complex subunit D [Desulfobacterales bacterium]